MSGPSLTRRGLLAAGIAVGFGAGVAGCMLPVIPKRPDPTVDDALNWIVLGPDGRFMLWSPRVEMGQNVLGALRRIAALELGIPEAAITVRMAGTADIGRVKATVGSDSVQELLLPLSQACASLRRVLLARASARLGRPAELLDLGMRAISAPDGSAVALAELAAPPIVLRAEETPLAALRVPAALGRLAQASISARGSAGSPATATDDTTTTSTTTSTNTANRADVATATADPDTGVHEMPQLRALVTGAPLFTADVRLPGLLHAAVLHPPWRPELGMPGPRDVGLDEAALRQLPGLVALLRLPELDGPVLVATHPAALPALRTAAAPRWTAPANAPDPMRSIDIDQRLQPSRLTKDHGSVQDGPWSVDLRLDMPLAAHAGLEPRCAVARFRPDGALELWCGTQDPFYVRDALARDHGLPAEKVIVHAMRIGGGFGSRAVVTVEREAAFIARAVGAPVKLQWSREDEFLAGHHRPPYSHRIRARLGRDGRVTDWWHALSSSHTLFTSAAMPAWMQRFTDLVGDAGTARGQHAPYAFTRQRRAMALTRLPLATGPWRGLGAGPNGVAIEAAMDALARQAGQDPVDFRLRHLAAAPAGEHLQSPARLAEVLRRVAARARQVPPAVPQTGERIGRGVACAAYKGRSLAAAVAEVVVTAQAIRVTRIWCSHDCGAMVDPRGVRAQVEGNLVWGLGLVLSDELPAPHGTPTITQLGAYALPRLADMPVLDIDLVVNGEAPSGAGESALAVGAAAIFNAVAAAMGRTPKRLPLRAAELLADSPANGAAR